MSRGLGRSDVLTHVPPRTPGITRLETIKTVKISDANGAIQGVSQDVVQVTDQDGNVLEAGEVDKVAAADGSGNMVMTVQGVEGKRDADGNMQVGWMGDAHSDANFPVMAAHSTRRNGDLVVEPPVCAYVDASTILGLQYPCAGVGAYQSSVRIVTGRRS